MAQLLPVETHTWPWPRAVAVVLAIIVGPFVLVGGLIGMFAAGLGWLAERVLGLAVIVALVGVLIWLARRNAPSPAACRT
jgi:cobalamin synthase